MCNEVPHLLGLMTLLLTTWNSFI